MILEDRRASSEVIWCDVVPVKVSSFRKSFDHCESSPVRFCMENVVEAYPIRAVYCNNLWQISMILSAESAGRRCSWDG